MPKVFRGEIDGSLENNFWLPKSAQSAQTVENSHRFFNVSYTWYKSLIHALSCLCVMLYKVVNCFVFQLETLPLWPFFATRSAGSLLHVFHGSERSWSNLFEKHTYVYKLYYFCCYRSKNNILDFSMSWALLGHHLN